MWNSFALAVQTLTRLPSLADATPTRDEARRAVFLLPLVGALIGAMLAAAWTLGSRVWPGQPLIPAALTLAAGAFLTGGRGLGGIARAADGLAAHGGGGDRTRAFAVMRDPRRGTTGLVALGVALALRLAFLSALPAALAWPALGSGRRHGRLGDGLCPQRVPDPPPKAGRVGSRTPGRTNS